MRFEQIANALYCTPWAIQPEIYFKMHELFQSHYQGTTQPEPESKKFVIWGQEVEHKMPQEYDIIEDVAVITISGILGKRLSDFEKACIGACDYDDICEAVELADSDRKVAAILFLYESPGGIVTGLEECGDFIALAGKPTVAYTDTYCASAAYYLMAGTDLVISAASAQVGSIGTMITFLDVTKAYENDGVKREMIVSGKYKGMAYPGVPLTPDQRELLQSRVTARALEFTTWVQDNRGEVPAEAMQGQMHLSNDALRSNLIDKIGTFEDAVIEARSLIN